MFAFSIYRFRPSKLSRNLAKSRPITSSARNHECVVHRSIVHDVKKERKKKKRFGLGGIRTPTTLSHPVPPSSTPLAYPVLLSGSLCLSHISVILSEHLSGRIETYYRLVHEIQHNIYTFNKAPVTFRLCSHMTAYGHFNNDNFFFLSCNYLPVLFLPVSSGLFLICLYLFISIFCNIYNIDLIVNNTILASEVIFIKIT